MDEQVTEQHQEFYDDIASAKKQALETTTDLINKDNILTRGQELLRKIAVNLAVMDAVLDSLSSKVSETIVAAGKLSAPLAGSYSEQIVLIEVKMEAVTAMFNTLISLDTNNATRH